MCESLSTPACAWATAGAEIASEAAKARRAQSRTVIGRSSQGCTPLETTSAAVARRSAGFAAVLPGEIRPPLPRQPLRLLAAPAGDRSVVAGEEHVRDGAPFPLARPRVMRVFEEAALEALLGRGGVLAHHARQEPDAGVEERHGGDLAPGKHVIADGDLLEGAARD